MRNLSYVAAMAVMALLVEPAFAQQPAAKEAQTAKPAAASPEDFDKQYAKMQEQMTRMQEQMNKIAAAKDPKERDKLLQEHWATMQSAMQAMHGTFGGAGMGPGMMGPGMMGGGGWGMMGAGGHMMGWPDYKNLTPEQLKQRQYMMDRWIPMQQQMMNQMMQHQYWMWQAPSASPPTPPTPPTPPKPPTK